MKSKNIIVFSVVAVINSISAYLLYVFNYQKFQQNDFVKLVVLYLFSLFTYRFFFVFYTIKEKIKKTPISSPVAVICSVIAFIAIILNLKNDFIIDLNELFSNGDLVLEELNVAFFKAIVNAEQINQIHIYSEYDLDILKKINKKFENGDYLAR